MGNIRNDTVIYLNDTILREIYLMIRNGRI